MPPAGDQGQPGDLNHLLRGKEYTRCMGELGGVGHCMQQEQHVQRHGTAWCSAKTVQFRQEMKTGRSCLMTGQLCRPKIWIFRSR